MADSWWTAGFQLSKEYVAMQTSPPPFVYASPDEKNILTCEYTAMCLSLSRCLEHSLADLMHVAAAPTGNYIIVSRSIVEQEQVPS